MSRTNDKRVCCEYVPVVRKVPMTTSRGIIWVTGSVVKHARDVKQLEKLRALLDAHDTKVRP